MAQTARLRSFGVLEARVQEEDGEKVGVGKKGREGWEEMGEENGSIIFLM